MKSIFKFVPPKVSALLTSTMIIYFFAVFSIIFFEEGRYTVLDGIYFLVVTLSTVGYGDVIPSHPITKIATILLIISGISTIAVTSETIVDSIRSRAEEPIYYLPKKRLKYVNHGIVTGITGVSLMIARFLDDRGIQVVLVDREVEEVKSARNRGFEAYVSQLNLLSSFEILNVEKASVLFTDFKEDNFTIDVALLVKEIATDILTFSSASRELSIKFGNLIGINRTYHMERLVASFVGVLSTIEDVSVLPNQDGVENKFLFMRVRTRVNFKAQFPEAIDIAKISPRYDGMVLHGNIDEQEYHSSEGDLIIAVPKASLHQERELKFDTKETKISKIYIGGYSESIADIVSCIEFPLDRIEIITFNEAERDLALKHGRNVWQVKKQQLKKKIEEKITRDDLVVNLFNKVTDSLFLSLMIRESLVYPKIYQMAQNEKQIRIFRDAGANIIFTGESLLSRAMFQIFTAEKKLTTSLVFQQNHIFEHFIKKGDAFDKVSFKN